jgi:hypothetical protein
MILLDLFGRYEQASSKSLEECRQFTVELGDVEDLTAVIKQFASSDKQRGYDREIVHVREEDGTKWIEGQYHNHGFRGIVYSGWWDSFTLEFTSIDGSVSVQGRINLDSTWSTIYKIWCSILLSVGTVLILLLGFSDRSFGSLTERIGFVIFMLLGIGLVSFVFWMGYRFMKHFQKIQASLLADEMMEDLKRITENR